MHIRSMYPKDVENDVTWIVGCTEGQVERTYTTDCCRKQDAGIALFMVCAAADAVWQVSWSQGGNAIARGMRDTRQMQCTGCVLKSAHKWISERD